MARGVSLHIGLNQVDPAHYQTWTGDLAACEADAESMHEIATSLGYTSTMLLTTAATRTRVSAAIGDAASDLAAGDIFLVSYAGHGGQVPDVNGDEPDGTDETWCLYDGMLIDDELHALWKSFAPGGRVLVFSDSCHSGTVTRAARATLDVDGAAKELKAFGIENPRYRFMPPAAAVKTYRANRAFYDGLGRMVAADAMTPPAATVRLFSGCQDNQVSADGVFNGLFTATMLGVWNEGAFGGDYPGFHREIVKRMPTCQTPNHYVIGPNAPSFDKQKPFAIEG